MVSDTVLFQPTSLQIASNIRTTAELKRRDGRHVFLTKSMEPSTTTVSSGSLIKAQQSIETVKVLCKCTLVNVYRGTGYKLIKEWYGEEIGEEIRGNIMVRSKLLLNRLNLETH